MNTRCQTADRQHEETARLTGGSLPRPLLLPIRIIIAVRCIVVVVGCLRFAVEQAHLEGRRLVWYRIESGNESGVQSRIEHHTHTHGLTHKRGRTAATVQQRNGPRQPPLRLTILGTVFGTAMSLLITQYSFHHLF